MDLAGWLQQQGLAQLEPKLREAGIDLDVLGELENADLAEIGLSLGDRKRLLKAISSLSATSSATASTPTSVFEPTPAAKDHLNVKFAERRQLTVMFCDLVGSTALSASLDPEDLQQVIGAYHQTVMAAVRPYDGHVAQLLGDGVLVYFGYPRAHEDDADRACRAGLAVIEAVGKSRPRGELQLQTRVGIATGPVVVGQIGAGTSAAEHSASGETPNLAARLQGYAQPGEIVISSETRQLIGASFELAALPGLSLKGFNAPVSAWRVLREQATDSRFEAQHPHELTQFIGRDGELASLLERWSMARDGDGQLVLLSGEAGIGKSRVSQALRERLKAEPSTTILWQCSPYFVSSALYPVVQQLERSAEIVSADAPEARSNKLEQTLAPTGLGSESLGFLLKLLGLPDGGRLPAGQTPQQEKASTLKALVDAVLGQSNQQPVLLLLEDAHWIDPTTEELLGQAIERLRDARVLILVTSRPEYSASWGNPTNLTRLALSRMGQRQCAALISSVTGGKALPVDVLAEIVKKTDGIPLFVEELTKTVIESGLLRETGAGYELKGSLSALAIPSTLQDSLMARLDRLAPAKEVAQVGAAIGRVFSHRLVAAVLKMSDGKLEEAIGDLERSELLFRRGVGPDAIYTFKHALVRDTAYNSMVRAQRVLRHAQIAAAIEQTEPETGSTQPELVALHYQEGAELGAAIRYWSAAGDLAGSRYANRDAATHYRSALKLLPESEPLERVLELEFDLQTKFGDALWLTLGWGSSEVSQAFARARELAASLGQLERLVLASARLSDYLNAAGRFAETIAMLERFGPDELARLQPMSRVRLLVTLSVAKRNLGQLADACAHLSEARRTLEGIPTARQEPIGGGHPLIWVLDGYAQVRFLQGFLEQASACTALANEVADRDGRAPGRSFAQWYMAMMAIWRREFTAAIPHARQSLEISTQIGYTSVTAGASVMLGVALVSTGQVEEGIETLQKGYSLWKAKVGQFHRAGYAVPAADALLTAGRTDEAREYVLEGRRAQDETEERYVAAELLRLGARLAELDGDRSGAEHGYRSAIDLAEGQGAKVYSLRAATDLANLLISEGRPAEGSSILRPIYDWFTEGLGYADLMRAKATLDAIN